MALNSPPEPTTWALETTPFPLCTWRSSPWSTTASSLRPKLLIAATVNGARALGREADYGTVEPGKLASLVVLDEDPLEDIRALRSVDTVIKRGTVYPRSAYRR